MRDDEAVAYYESITLGNRRGRRLLREVGAIVGGPDIYADLPGDDDELEPEVVAELKAQAAQIVEDEQYKADQARKDWRAHHPGWFEKRRS